MGKQMLREIMLSVKLTQLVGERCSSDPLFPLIQGFLLLLFYDLTGLTSAAHSFSLFDLQARENPENSGYETEAQRFR